MSRSSVPASTIAICGQLITRFSFMTIGKYHLAGPLTLAYVTNSICLSPTRAEGFQRLIRRYTNRGCWLTTPVYPKDHPPADSCRLGTSSNSMICRTSPTSASESSTALTQITSHHVRDSPILHSHLP